jgi:hypothetical protein
MFFLGTPIQQDERGRCTLLSPQTFPIQTAELQAFDQRILVRTLAYSLRQVLMTGTAAHEKGLARYPRGSVAYVRSLLGNRDRSPRHGSDPLRLHRYSVRWRGKILEEARRWNR